MERPLIIEKAAADLSVPPHLTDDVRAAFSWETVRAALDGLPGGGLNIAHEAVDRHARGPLRDRVAFRFVARDTEISYGDLARLTNRFANVLAGLGVERGGRLFILTGRIPELYVALLGSLKAGVVVSPLFSAFGPEPIVTRLNLGSATVLVTTPSLYLHKVAGIRGEVPSLRQVLLASEEGYDIADIPDVVDLDDLLDAASDEYTIVGTQPEDMALLHFTSGTTGRPKGAVHVHEAVLTHWMTGRYALDLHDDDVFWCTADPGWVTGTSYGVIAPLLHGVTSIVDEGDFDAERWYGILADQRVSVWYTAPTAVRMLMRSGADLARTHDFPALRFIASVGEPLNPEAVWWGKETLGLPIHDNWWQTETGGIMIANTPAMPIKPGSMGRALPGVDAAIVRRVDGTVEPVAADEEGELALRRGWPSMLRGYLGDDDRYRRCFAGDWYLSGDLARRDADGYFWFIGRADDVIKSAGHLIGPFEVESVLLEHPAVAEAAVIGMPDDLVGEVVRAFVSLKPGIAPGATLHRDIIAHARKRLGAAVAPKEIDFLPTLPRTRSGKIMRRLLKARALGLPEGDLSTLETASPETGADHDH